MNEVKDDFLVAEVCNETAEKYCLYVQHYYASHSVRIEFCYSILGVYITKMIMLRDYQNDEEYIIFIGNLYIKLSKKNSSK